MVSVANHVSEFDQGPQPPDPHLTGSKPPMWNLNKASPWHKAAAFCFALGASAREVSRKLGKSEMAVQNLMRQPWFQEQVSRIMAEYGSKDISTLLQGEQYNSLETLVRLRDDTAVPAASRIQCARDLLDRSLGKAVQRIETSGIPVSEDPVAEVEQLTMEINRLRKEVSPLQAQGSNHVAEGHIPRTP